MKVCDILCFTDVYLLAAKEIDEVNKKKYIQCKTPSPLVAEATQYCVEKVRGKRAAGDYFVQIERDGS